MKYYFGAKKMKEKKHISQRITRNVCDVVCEADNNPKRTLTSFTRLPYELRTCVYSDVCTSSNYGGDCLFFEDCSVFDKYKKMYRR